MGGSEDAKRSYSALSQSSLEEDAAERSDLEQEVHLPKYLKTLFRYRYGWLVVTWLPAGLALIFFFLFVIHLVLAPVNNHASVRPELSQLDHMRLALSATNEAFEPAEQAPIPEGLFIPEVDPANVCVVQADTRPISSSYRPDYGALNLSTIADMAYWDATLRHNLLYAARHGYRFMRFSLEPIEGLYRTWSKIPALLKAVEQCEYTIFLDSDAYINKPQYSLYELMKHWGFHNKATFLQAMDPEDSPANNFNTTNTGFWIIRSNALAKSSLNDLIRCPFDIEGCDEWAMKWSNEQMAWTKYIRPKLVEGKDFIIAPCYEANGYWYTSRYSGTGQVEKCKGSLVTHGWQAKPNIAGRIEKILSGEIAQWLQVILDGSPPSEQHSLTVP